MRKLFTILILLLCVTFAYSQTRVITGKVTDEKGSPVEGATVKIKGTKSGVAADANGVYKIAVTPGAKLLFSGVGISPQELSVGKSDQMDVTLTRIGTDLQNVVVTALGIKRNRNLLSASTQLVSGDDVSKQRNSNFVSNLSGKVSGLELRQSNTLGGSISITLRGAKTIGSSNEPLFVVDGVPFDNSNESGNSRANISNTATSNQATGRGGYDYGNASADLNPDDIESITVLKGASAALYGSRGGNGVILITTKLGAAGKRKVNVTVNSGYTIGAIDKSTFSKFQHEYGGGYNDQYEDKATGRFLYRDPVTFKVMDPNTPGGILIVPTSEDASYGGKFDPNLMVYNWNAFDPTSPYYHKATPFVAAKNDPTAFFEKQFSTNQSVQIDGGSEKSSFKLGYTRNDEKGILPNSHIHKNLIAFASSYAVTDKLTAGANINFSNVDGLGRYGTGYDGGIGRNMATNFREWWQMNVDVLELKDAYERTQKNVTWNWADPTNLKAIYWNNPYYTRYQNYENDTRNRFFGNVNLNYKLLSWLNILGKVGLDHYAEFIEDRVSVTSKGTPFYARYNHTFSETNFDLLLSADKDISPSINLKGLFGVNIRKDIDQSIAATTNGGLLIPGIYSLNNSLNPIAAPFETDLRSQVNGIFGGATFSYKNTFIVDGTIRRDESSTLPKGNNSYVYPSVSTGFVFSKLLPQLNWLSFGKLTANWAQVGNDTRPYRTLAVYTVNTPYGSNPQFSVPGTAANPNLKPERTKSNEIGLESSLFKGRAGFSVSYYTTKTYDQIFAVAVSTSTGNNSKFLNSGAIQNKGIELSAYATPVKLKNFSWNVNVNWTRNRNKVVDLYTNPATGLPVNNIVIGSFQRGITLNATLGQPFGTIRGTDFVYTNGQRTVGANGNYLISPTIQNIGDPNPNWIAGITNTLKYKNISLSWLIDVHNGGKLYSLDMAYGLSSGIYPETAGLNDLGNPKRNSLANGGGIIRPGVTADGKTNTIRVDASNSGAYGYDYSPNMDNIYDASYIKLREVNLVYSLPTSLINKLHAFKGIDISLVGRNLWIIHKNIAYVDPEEIISSGNLQGLQVGAYPTVKTVTFNLKFKF